MDIICFDLTVDTIPEFDGDVDLVPEFDANIDRIIDENIALATKVQIDVER